MTDSIQMEFVVCTTTAKSAEEKDLMRAERDAWSFVDLISHVNVHNKPYIGICNWISLKDRLI